MKFKDVKPVKLKDENDWQIKVVLDIIVNEIASNNKEKKRVKRKINEQIKEYSLDNTNVIMTKYTPKEEVIL